MDIPEEVKEDICFIPVKNYKEIYQNLFEEKVENENKKIKTN